MVKRKGYYYALSKMSHQASMVELETMLFKSTDGSQQDFVSTLRINRIFNITSCIYTHFGKQKTVIIVRARPPLPYVLLYLNYDKSTCMTDNTDMCMVVPVTIAK